MQEAKSGPVLANEDRHSHAPNLWGPGSRSLPGHPAGNDLVVRWQVS